MRSGKLDRVIVLQSFTSTVTDYGTPIEAWSDFARLRAEIVQAGAKEYLRGYGESAEATIVFRTRFLAGLTTAHRVVFDGRHFNIREIAEIGRKRGLELRAEAMGDI